jgi:hypothetical protein
MNGQIGTAFIRPGYQQYKRRILIAAAIFTALTTPSLILFDEGTPKARLFDIISVIGYGILVLGWCYYDGLERNKPIGAGFRILIVIFGGLALFVYLIKSRGFSQGLRSIGKALLVCAGMLVVMFVSAGATAVIFGVE